MAIGPRLPFLLLGIAILSSSLFGQTKSPATAAAPRTSSDAKPADYSQEAVVLEHFTTKLTFEADGTGVREVNAVMKVQADAGVQQLAVIRFPFNSYSETVDVDYVRVRKADGTVVNTPAYNIQDLPADLTREAPMYSDIHEKHITVKALGVGDTLEYLIRFRTTKAEVPGQFWFAHNFVKDAICKDEQLEVSFPKDKYVNVSSTGVQPQTHEENGRKIYIWKSSSLARKEPNKDEIPKREAPRPDIELTTFHSWTEVGAWYATLQKDQLTVTPELQKRANELTKGLTTDDQKIRALYDFVSTHFHYVSLSFGIGRYQPHAADDVLGNEYGDCKDKHTLLATMLKAVGIDAWAVLINSSRKIDDDLPAPSSFDHVITVVPRGKDLIWLDSTPEVSPFGLLLMGLRDKQALVVPSDKPALLMKTPDSMPFPYRETFNAEGKLGSDGIFTGHMERTSRGDTEVVLRATYRQISQAQWKELTQRLSNLTGFAGDVDNVKVSPPEDTSKPFDVSYDYTRKHYGDWDNHRVTPPMPIFGLEAADTDERKPVEPFLLGDVGEMVYHAKVELPPDSKAVAPPDVDVSEDFAEYHAKYSIKNGVLVAERRLVLKKKEVAVAAWDRYTKFRKAISDDEDHWINLDGSESTNAKVDDSEAGKKFQEALTALQNRDLVKGSDLLQEVLRLDPKYVGAHANLAWTYMAQNRRAEAVAEIQKEEELHPNYIYSYGVGAWIYGAMQRTDDAIDQYRRLVKVQPDNRDAVLKLASMLHNAEKYTEEVTLLESAVKVAPESQPIQVQLAKAYLNVGEKDKALAIIDKNVNETSPALVLNDVAYALANANVYLDRARQLSEASLQTITDSSLKTSTSDNESLSLTTQLASFWGTLGWIYFRMGQYGKAESYLRPAWLLLQRAVVGDHLGQTYEKLGKTKAAEHIYQLAWAASGGSREERDEVREHFKKLTGKSVGTGTEIHRLPNGKWTETPGEELSRMRTFKVQTESAPKGNATFALAFADGKVQDLAYVGGAEELKPIAEKLKTMKFDMAYPEGSSKSRVVRRGILLCSSSGCDFTFLLSDGSSFITNMMQF